MFCSLSFSRCLIVVSNGNRTAHQFDQQNEYDKLIYNARAGADVEFDSMNSVNLINSLNSVSAFSSRKTGRIKYAVYDLCMSMLHL